eukprot:s575_g17.t1
MAPAVRQLESVLENVKTGKFRPDETRSGRFVPEENVVAAPSEDQHGQTESDSDSAYEPSSSESEDSDEDPFRMPSETSLLWHLVMPDLRPAFVEVPDDVMVFRNRIRGCDNSAADAVSAKCITMTSGMSHVIAQYFMFMRRFHMYAEISHIPGHLNKLADALSRFETPPEHLDLSAQLSIDWRDLMKQSDSRVGEEGRSFVQGLKTPTLKPPCFQAKIQLAAQFSVQRFLGPPIRAARSFCDDADQVGTAGSL